MKRKIKYYRLLWLKHDLPAGLSVFLIALPLCLGIALASGAPIYAGLLSGIVGGLVVSLISGSQLGVSGPAAGLTTVVAASIISLGGYQVFLLAVIIAGLFQVILGLFKLGVIASYFPSAVIKGMLAAIGLILILNQVPQALGYNQSGFWKNAVLHLFSTANPAEHFRQLSHLFSKGAIAISIASLSILILLRQPFANRLRWIPGPLVVVVAGIIMNILFKAYYPLLSLDVKQLVHIPSNIFAQISLPDFSLFFSNINIWKDGLIIGLLATLETLLCSEAVDKLDQRNRITPVNRELVAQGVGNMLCGAIGAIPLTAVVVRGAANIDAGARTKLSAFTHGAFMLLSVLLIPTLLNQIPYACLAAILLMTGYNLTKPALYANMWSLGWTQWMPFAITIAVILFTDLLIGVSFGLLISIFFIIRNNFKAEYRITHVMQHATAVYLIKLNSNVTFLNKVKLKTALDQIPPYSVLTIDGSECNFIDYDILEIISEYSTKAHDRHIELHLEGIKKVSVMGLH